MNGPHARTLRATAHQLKQWFDSWFFADAPKERLALFRIAVFGFMFFYLLARAVHLVDYARFPSAAFAPIGVVSWLTEPLAQSLTLGIYGVTVLSTGMAALGYRYSAAAKVSALGFLWLTTYRSSWGMIFHTENLLVLHALLLSPAPAADAWAIDARRNNVHAAKRAGTGTYGWVLRAACLVTVSTYVIAGLAKLDLAGLEWLSGEHLREHIAYDGLRKTELGGSSFGAAHWVVPQGWLFTPLALATLAVEFGAPVALLSRRAAFAWCVSVWAFHLGVTLVMAIVFPYALLGVAFFPFFALETRAAAWLQRLRSRRAL